MTMSILAARGLELLLLLVSRWRSPRRRRHPPADRRARAAGCRPASAGVDGGWLQPGGVRLDLTRRLAQLGERLPVLDPMQRVKLGLQLTRAGASRAASVMIGIKLSCGVLFACGAIVFSPLIPRFGEYFVIRALAMIAAFVIGVIVPEYVLGVMIRRRRRIIAACFPDALDLLVICTMAGNSLASGIRRVAHELARICPPLADELTVCADELTLSGDVSATLAHFAMRVDFTSARSLATTLTQSQRFGTPITQALRTLSRTERTEQIVALEERAAKLAPKITLPMMLFILPTVCLIAAPGGDSPARGVQMTRSVIRAFALAALLPVLAGGCGAPGVQTRPVLSHKSDDPQAELRIADSALAGGNVDLASTLYEGAREASRFARGAPAGDVNYRAGDPGVRGFSMTKRSGRHPRNSAAARARRVAAASPRRSRATLPRPARRAAEPSARGGGAGTVLDLQGRHADAQVVYRDALRAHPDAQGLRVDLGLSLVLSNRPREGVNVLLDVTGLPSAPWQARQNLAFAYGVLGNTDSAKKLLSAELPASAVADNLRFYQAVRARLASRGRWSGRGRQPAAAVRRGAGAGCHTTGCGAAK